MLTKAQRAGLIKEWESQLQDLVVQRQELVWLDHRINTLRGLIAGAKAWWDEDSIAQQKASLGLTEMPPPKPIALPTIAEATKNYMAQEGKAVHVRDLLTVLRRQGLLLSGKNPLSSVALALKRRPDWFVKVGPNTFALVRNKEATTP